MVKKRSRAGGAAQNSQSPSVVDSVPQPLQSDESRVAQSSGANSRSKCWGLAGLSLTVIAAVIAALLLSAGDESFPPEQPPKSAADVSTLQKRRLTSRAVVFGFLPDYRFDSADLEFIIPRVTHLCLFGSEADPKTGAPIIKLPSSDRLDVAKRVAKQSGTKLLLGFGGAGRSDFFAPVLNNAQLHGRFRKDLVAAMKKEQLDGIEMNWMYPSTSHDVGSLKRFVSDIKADLPGILVTMSLPPDRQFARAIVPAGFDLLHIMVYQGGVARSDSLSFAKTMMTSIIKEAGDPGKLTLGLPFYGSMIKSGEVVSYEEIFTRHEGDFALARFEDSAHLLSKIALAEELRIAGVAIWEVGQDCRPRAVGSHAQTCPKGPSDSLLGAISA